MDATGRRIISKEWSDAAGSQGWYLLHTASRLEFSRIRNSVWNNASRAALTAGTRYHVVITYDGTTMRLYVNGALAGSGGSTQALVDSPAAFAMARGPTGQPVRGNDRRARRLLRRGANGAQVQAHYDAGK